MDVVPGYEPLAEVFQTAHDQAARGKGLIRHANAKPFLQQPIFAIGRMVGIGYNVGQAMKKGQEAMRLPDDRAQAELLGAMVYLASAYLLIAERMEGETARAAFTPVQEEKVSEPISCGTCGHNGYGCTPDALVAGCHNWTRKAEGAATFPFTFPPALKWMGKEGREYVEKLLEEVNEVGETNVDDPRSTMMEAFDVVHVAETMIRTIAKETGIDPAEVAGEVVAKNSKRNYYQG